MSQVDLLEVVQVPVPEDVLIDAEEVVEAEVEDLGGGVQGRDLGEGRVEALHRLLASLPLADAVLGTVAIRGGFQDNKKEDGYQPTLMFCAILPLPFKPRHSPG